MTDLLVSFFDIYDHAHYICEEVIANSVFEVWEENLRNLIEEFELRDFLPSWLHWLFRGAVIWFMAVLSLILVGSLTVLVEYAMVGSSSLETVSVAQNVRMGKHVEMGVGIEAAMIVVTIILCMRAWEFAWNEESEEPDFYEEDFTSIWGSVLCLVLLGAICGTAFDQHLLLFGAEEIRTSPVYLPEIIFLGQVILLALIPERFKQLRMNWAKALYLVLPILHRFPEEEEDDEEDTGEDDVGEWVARADVGD